MAVLTTKERKQLPKSTFGIPKKRAYPMPDRSHAANAKARAKQMLNAGKLSQAEYKRIVKKADMMLYGKKGKKKVKDINEAKHGGGLAHCRKSHEKAGAFGLFHFYGG